MKSSELLLIVDSVEEAVKFYTEKLGFDIVHLEVQKDNANLLQAAHIRKGKCFIRFRAPYIEELAEFSFIKRCVSRCVGLHIEIKKGLDKYIARCQKKGLKIATEPSSYDTSKSYSLRDPFGLKVIFSEPIDLKNKKPSLEFVGMHISEQDASGRGRKESELSNEMIDHLRVFGILRRAAKKYAKHKLKLVMKK